MERERAVAAVRGEAEAAQQAEREMRSLRAALADAQLGANLRWPAATRRAERARAAAAAQAEAAAERAATAEKRLASTEAAMAAQQPRTM